jgi:hypothetical protein
MITEDKPVGGITRIYTDIPQENSLSISLYLKQTKMSCFSFSFFFLFCKIGEQEGVIGPAQSGWLVSVGGGRWWGKRVGG